MRLHMEANKLFASVGDVGGAGYTLSRASLSAYGMEEYEEALRLGRAGYVAFSEVDQATNERLASSSWIRCLHRAKSDITKTHL